MNNPFRYTGVVSGEAFCNREKELIDLLRAMENSDKLFIYSERRFGKTSLAKLALEKLPKKQYVSAYVDMWPTDNEISFTTATAKAITESMSTSVEKMIDTAKTFFRNLTPSFTFDDDGKPQVAFGIRSASNPAPGLDEVLEAPAKIAIQGGRKVVIVFDEFQQILEYGGDMVERRLRSIIQHHRDVAYIFLGSRKHLIRKMFLDESRPLYRAAGHYPLKPIDEEHWIPFIQRRFAAANKQIVEEHIRSICFLTEGHPYYTQHLCHVLWESCEEGGQVTADSIESVVQLLLDRENYAYTMLWESLTVNQRKVLKGLASESAGVKPFSSTFTRRYGFSSASNVQRAIDPLMEKDVIDRDNGSFVITDRFFRIWIQTIHVSGDDKPKELKGKALQVYEWITENASGREFTVKELVDGLGGYRPNHIRTLRQLETMGYVKIAKKGQGRGEKSVWILA
jgi:hypothetical protein